MLRLPCSFSYFNNFGDSLNKYIYKQIKGVDVVISPIEKASFLGVGSVLDNVYKIGSGENRHPLYVFSSGFKNGYHEKGKVNIYKGSRPLILKAIRGKLSMKVFETANIGFEGKPVLGDGGILASCLVKNKSDVQKKYKTGFVFHALEIGHPMIKVIRKYNPGALFLDIRQKPDLFIRQLLECETIVSSALHPLIASDSLQIPNARIILENGATTDFKFDDYRSAFGFSDNTISLADIGYTITSDMIYNVCERNYEIVEERKELLLCAMDEMVNELEPLRDYYYLDYKKNRARYLLSKPKRYILQQCQRVSRYHRNRKIIVEGFN